MNDAIDQIIKLTTSDIDQIARDTSLKKGIAFSDIQFILLAVTHVCRNDILGDIIEMGCCTGDTSVAIRKAMNAVGTDKTLHVCDSFMGLPKPSIQDMESSFNSTGFCEGALRTTPDAVRDTFTTSGVNPPIIHHGWFGEIKNYPPNLAFAFVDGDLYQSIWDGLQAVYLRMSSGGIIVVHDYNYPPLPGARKACDKFFSDKYESVIPYADSAVIIKDLL